MNRENFARLCILVSAVGLGIMYFSTQFMRPEKVAVSEVSRSDIGRSLRVEGEVTGFYTTDSASFFQLKSGNSSIMVVDFQKRRFSGGETVVVTGKVDLYRGSLELVSTEIEQK
ncbi:MAG: exodeoxyribonuclease VII large subunit [Candidatus Nanohalobium sp.]